MRITNFDGAYIADDPRDFCRHGRYVGGCGYDFMCGACEMGDPDLTLAEARRVADREIADFWDLFDRLVANVGHVEACGVIDRLGEPVFATLANAVELVRSIAEVAHGPWDDDYLGRLQDEAIAEWLLAKLVDA